MNNYGSSNGQYKGNGQVNGTRRVSSEEGLADLLTDFTSQHQHTAVFDIACTLVESGYRKEAVVGHFQGIFYKTRKLFPRVLRLIERAHNDANQVLNPDNVPEEVRASLGPGARQEALNSLYRFICQLDALYTERTPEQVAAITRDVTRFRKPERMLKRVQTITKATEGAEKYGTSQIHAGPERIRSSRRHSIGRLPGGS